LNPLAERNCFSQVEAFEAVAAGQRRAVDVVEVTHGPKRTVTVSINVVCLAVGVKAILTPPVYFICDSP
jgi:hypothetical protein